MPAPVRAPKKTISIANDAIFASNEIQPTAPIVVRPPGSSDTGHSEYFKLAHKSHG